jgi:hypothetical protein
MRRILIKEDIVDFVVRELRARAYGDRRISQAAEYIECLRPTDGVVGVSLPIESVDACALALTDTPSLSRLFTGDVR